MMANMHLFGNPKSYATWLDENLNKAPKETLMTEEPAQFGVALGG